MPITLDGINVTPTAREAAQDFGYDVSKGNIDGVERVNKFGYNAAVGATLEAIWDYSGTYSWNADDTFVTMYISSDNAGDQNLPYTVQGINSEYDWDSVDITTDGASGFTFVPIVSNAADGLWWRVNRALHTAPSTTAALGNIYISRDNTDVGGNGIPDTVADIQAEILIGMEQTLMALWTIPRDRKAYLTHFYSSTSVAKVTEVRLYYRPFGGVFNIKHIVTINASSYQHEWHFPGQYAGKGDLMIQATAAGGGGKVAAGFSLWHE